MQLSPQAVRRAVVVSVLVALVALAYLPTVDAPFVFDDHNDILRGTLGHFWASVQGSRRPLTTATFVFSWWMGAGEPWAFRVFNVLVHAIAALCAYALGRRILRSERLNLDEPVAERLAALAAALWAVHPLTTSAVTYVTHRYESLAGMFYLASLLAYLRERERRTIPWLTALLCALGALSKEILVTLPVAVWILDAVVFGEGLPRALRARWRSYLTLAVALTPLIALARTHSAAPSQGVQPGLLSRWDYLVSEPSVLTHYLRLAVWPHPLTNDYFDWPIGFQATGLVALGLLALTLWGLVRKALWSAPFAMFFLVLAPSSSLIPLYGELAAERRMYVPLVGLALFGVVAAYRLASRFRARVQLAWSLLGAGVVAALLAATLVHNRLYMSRLLLYSSEIEARPGNGRSRVWFVSYLVGEGQIAEAAAELAGVDPNAPGYAIAATRVATGARRYDEAARWGRLALLTHPDDSQAVLVAAIAFGLSGDGKGAVELLERRINGGAGNADLVELLAWNLATDPDVRDGHRAVALAERAAQMKGANVPPYYRETLAAALAAAGRWDEALQWADQLLAAADAAGKPDRAQRLAAQRAKYAKHLPWSRADDRALSGEASPALPKGSAKGP